MARHNVSVVAYRSSDSTDSRDSSDSSDSSESSKLSQLSDSSLVFWCVTPVLSQTKIDGRRREWREWREWKVLRTRQSTNRISFQWLDSWNNYQLANHIKNWKKEHLIRSDHKEGFGLMEERNNKEAIDRTDRWSDRSIQWSIPTNSIFSDRVSQSIQCSAHTAETALELKPWTTLQLRVGLRVGDLDSRDAKRNSVKRITRITAKLLLSWNFLRNMRSNTSWIISA